MSKKPTHQSHVIAKASVFQGPIPHPEMLGRFDEIVPGLAKQITDDAFANSNHTRSVEQTSIEAQAGQIRASNFVAVYIAVVVGIIALGSVGASIYLIMIGKSAEGLSTLATVAISALVGKAIGKKESR